MFEFTPEDKIIDYTGPIFNEALQYCSECSQIAFRVLHVKSGAADRQVGLCGAHFTDACRRYPEISLLVSLRFVSRA